MLSLNSVYNQRVKNVFAVRINIVLEIVKLYNVKTCKEICNAYILLNRSQQDSVQHRVWKEERIHQIR